MARLCVLGNYAAAAKARLIASSALFTKGLTAPAPAFEEIGIGHRNSLPQRGLGTPAQTRQLRNIQEFLRRTVRARRVEDEHSTIADDIGYEPRELGDCDVLPGPDVEELVRRVVFHHEGAGVGQVIHRKELPAWLHGAPHGHGRRTGQLGFMQPAD